MPSPCSLSYETFYVDESTNTLHIFVTVCSVTQKKCNPNGCPYANDPKYQKEAK